MEHNVNIAVVGSRTFEDYDLLEKALDRYTIPKQDTIISGGARGADSLARRYARENGIRMVEHFPNWKRHGRVAGFLRNEKIVKDAEVVVAFWDGKSKGTQHTISLAERKGIDVHVVEFGP
jgi:hypothetical protein